MSPRENHIPFILWLCAALLAHALWSGSALVASKFLYAVRDIRAFAQAVRSDVAGDGPIEIALAEEKLPEDPTVEPPPDKPPEVKPDDPAKKDQDKPEPEKAETKPDPIKEKDKQQIVILPTPQQPQPPPPPPPKDGRIAVKQHVKDKNQADNPNARFVGDEANKVEEESVARATSHDQDDPNPTFGGQHSSPDKTPGNADKNKVGSGDDHKGEPDKAPGEGSTKDNAALPAATPAKPGAVVNPNAPDPPKTPPPPAPGNGQPLRTPTQPAPAQPQPAPEQGPSNPDAVTTDKGNGSYSLDPRRRTSPSTSAAPPPSAIAKAPVQPGLGLGKGPNDRGVQLNLNQKDVVASVGVDELRRQRATDGERRRSEHRGTWQSSSFARWRPAIENYVSSVRPGNQTALNTARVPFAAYLVSIHNRIHPIFADAFLDTLDSLPGNHPMNDQKMFTSLEIVVDSATGRVVKMGVTRTSGQTAFDIAALDSVHRAQPFGKAPDAIQSTDGNVYLHWEFHRNPMYACSTMNARPYMLNNPPPVQQPTPPGTPPKQPADPKERQAPPGTPPGGPSNGSRYGQRMPQALPPRG